MTLSFKSAQLERSGRELASIGGESLSLPKVVEDERQASHTIILVGMSAPRARL
jgi:hypothetical protein